MKHSLRLIALLLALVLALQAPVLAADPADNPDPTQTVLPDPGTAQDPEEQQAAEPDPAQETDPPSDPPAGEQPEDPDPGEDPAEPEPIVITPSLDDGLVTRNPVQLLRVTAVQGDVSLEPGQLRVSLNGAPVDCAGGDYILHLDRGENTLAVDAATDTAEASLTLILTYKIPVPEGWAHDALSFCVDYGILNGDDNGDLLPERNATRAQLAAMLVRLFDARPMASLSGYTDVPENAWYHDEMSRAVAMGIFEGSNGRLNPENPITREQAFTVLARAFGVAASTTDALEPFPDAGEVSLWAQHSVAGMLEADYVHGSTSGRLNPKGFITRQELAQVLYNALDCITGDPDALTGSRCLYTGPIEALEGKTVQGSLIISSGETGDVTLDSLRVSGRLTLHLHSAESAVLGPVSDTVALCSPVRLTLTAPVSEVLCLRDGAFISGSADRASLSGGILRGSFGTVYCLEGENVIATDSHVDELYCAANMAGRTLTLYGDVDSLHAKAHNLTLEGTRIGTLYQYCNDLWLQCPADSVVDRIDAGLDGVKILPGSIPDANYTVRTVTVTGTISGVNTTQLYGVPDGVRTVSVTYRYGDRVIKTDPAFRLTEGAVLSCELTPTLRDRVSEEQRVYVAISYNNQTVTGVLTLRASGYNADVGLDGVQINPGSIPDAYYDVTTVTVSGTVSGVNTVLAGSAPKGVRTVTVTYRYGGKVIKTDPAFQLYDGAVLSCEVTPTLRYQAVEEQAVSVTIAYGSQTVTGELKLRANGYYTAVFQARNVLTCKVRATITYTTGIYGYSSLSSWLGSVSSGTVVQFIKSNGSTALIETSGGLRGWVPDSAVRVSWQTYHNDNVEYSKEVKEAFVNEVHDYSSATNYLIWCNLYTTTVNIFQGSQGNWKLIHSGECCIGTPATPTRPGIYSLYSRAYYWSFDGGGKLDYSRCYYASLFDGGIAFHTRLYITGTNTYVNSALSAEISHGCVRCPDDIAKFIYYQCPLGTKVVVY